MKRGMVGCAPLVFRFVGGVWHTLTMCVVCGVGVRNGCAAQATDVRMLNHETGSDHWVVTQKIGTQFDISLTNN